MLGVWVRAGVSSSVASNMDSIPHSVSAVQASLVWACGVCTDLEIGMHIAAIIAVPRRGVLVCALAVLRMVCGRSLCDIVVDARCVNHACCAGVMGKVVLLCVVVIGLWRR
jgi:hypothetical protein